MSSVKLLLLACVVGMLASAPAFAEQVTNPVSKFEIEVDGQFTDGVPIPIGEFMGEWGDVIPLAFISPETSAGILLPAVLGDPNANSLLYAAIAPGGVTEGPGIDGLYLLYDYLPRTDQVFTPGEFIADITFPVTFRGVPETDITVQIRGGGVAPMGATPLIGGFFDVFVGIDVNGDGVSDGPASQIGIEAAIGFGPSTLSATDHLLIELEVPLLIPEGFGTGQPGELPSGDFPGDGHGSGYSPAPAFWGSGIANDLVDPPATAAFFNIDHTGAVIAFSVSPAAVPEPSTLLLLASGLLGLGVYRWRGRRT